MLRSLSFLGALSALLLLSAPHASAQQTRPARKPAPHQPVSSTAKRSSSTTKASGANSTSAAATATSGSGNSGSTGADNNATTNNPDTPNTVNANGSIGSQESADGKGQGAYAAPGEPINLPSGRKTDSYDGKAPKKPATSKGNSTLKPGGRQ